MKFKSTLLLGLGFAAIVGVALAQQPGINSNLNTVFTIPLDGTKSTYSAAVVGLSPNIVATDIAYICGSATRTVRVTRFGMSGRATAVQSIDVTLVKRSTANSGGTCTAATKVPNDSSYVAGTATVSTCTANPVLGTTVGNVVSQQLQLGNLTTGVGGVPIAFHFGNRPATAVVLRGAAQCLGVNLNAGSAGGNSLQLGFEWTEE